MFDFKMLGLLGLHAFSFTKGSLRYPTLRRSLNVFITLPLFLVLIMINRVFMAMDHLLFPGFKKMQLKKCAFITGVPRSATTYAYHLLARDTQNFTCFKMWELLFAPSITQKYLLTWALKVDRLVGRPMRKLSRWWDRIFLQQIKRLHDTGLSKPEEDEILLLHAFASVYLIYFFPGVRAVEPYLFFDNALSAEKRTRIMCFYKRSVQRHVFFYDRDEARYFLSKNPSFVSKTVSLADTFDDARMIYMLRSPARTIPSTINLNRSLYAMFSGVSDSDEMASLTKDIVIQWYRMADRSIARHWKERCITIPFRKITQEPEAALQMIYQFLRLPQKHGVSVADDKADGGHVRQVTYKVSADVSDVMGQLDFIYQGPYRDDL